MSLCQKPIIGVPASIVEMAGNQTLANTSAKRYIDSLKAFSNCLSLIIPALGDAYDFDQLLDKFDGILLTGGRANIEPHHYGGPPFPPEETTDPDRDNTVLPMIRACIERKMPLLGVCRGIQEMNVAMGGTLYYRVNEVPGKNDHRMPRGENIKPEQVFQPRHLVRLTPGGLFQKLINADKFKVNSLHGQGIDRIADVFNVEAVTIEDDVIEGIRLKDDETFTVGVQWHTEWKPEEPEHLLSRKIYEEFGKAAQKYAEKKSQSLPPIWDDSGA